MFVASLKILDNKLDSINLYLLLDATQILQVKELGLSKTD